MYKLEATNNKGKSVAVTGESIFIVMNKFDSKYDRSDWEIIIYDSTGPVWLDRSARTKYKQNC